MERLNPLDAQFIDAEDEDRQTSFAIASIAVFEGPAPSYDEFLHAIEGRLPLVPLYRRKLRTVPFRLGRRPELRHPLPHPAGRPARARRG